MGRFMRFMRDMLSRIYFEDLGATVPGRARIIVPKVTAQVAIALNFREFSSDGEISREIRSFIPRVDNNRLLVMRILAVQARLKKMA